MISTRVVRAAAIAAPLCLAGMARADILIYSNTFESGTLGPEWSKNAALASTPAFTTFMGRKANETIRLTVPVPLRATSSSDNGDDGDDDSGGDTGGGGGGNGGGNGGGGGGGPSYRVYRAAFDLYTIDSWDGTNGAYGPDLFEVLVNGSLAFSETFATGHVLTQTYRAADVGPVHLGFSPAYTDAIYRQIAIEFTLPEGASVMTLDFRGRNLQPIQDESWGIDNVNISYTVVPAPGPTALGVIGVLCLGRRRR